MGHKKKKKFAKSRESDVLDAGSEKRNVQASQAADSSININLNVNVNRNIRQQPFDENREDTGEQQEDTEESVYRSVIRKCTPKLVEDLEPDYLLDWFAQAGFLTSVKVRDIRELNTTSEKTHKILELVSSKADRGYKELKDALIKTRQHNLVEYLEDTEKEVELEKEAKRKDLGPLTADRPTDASKNPVDKAHKTVIKEESVKTYAEILNQTRPVEENITCNIVNYFNVPEKETRDSKADGKKCAEMRKFWDSVLNFKGDFILLIDRFENVYNLEALALVPWIAVLDFDPKSRQSGVLSRVENCLKTKRSLQILSIQNKSSVTERSTNWIFMSGCQDQLDTITSVEHKQWRKEIRPYLYNHLQKLKEFSEAYTRFTLVIVWPCKTDKAKHIQFVVGELEDSLSPAVVLVYEDFERSKKSDPVLNAFEEEDDIEKIHITLQDMCTLFISKFKTKNDSVSAKFQLPDSDSVLGITEDKAQWLSEELEVIYLSNNTGISYEQHELHEEEDMFFKGGTLHWAWWYQVGSGHLDIERDQLNDIVEHLQKNYISIWKSGIITLYHAPGSGGTTLAQRVLWTLRKEVPCAQLKRGSSSSVFELTERIRFLCDKTSKPVFILIDGEDEQRVESVQRSLREHCVIIFYVKRYPYKIEKGRLKIHEGKVWLNSGVSKDEARVLGLKHKRQCKSAQKTEAITHLVTDVEHGKFHSIFDFGLTAHSHEYRGIESYVEGYLRLNKNESAFLEPWQQAVAYLAFVYYYGQASLPCFFISCILDKKERKMLRVEDLPREMSEFIVRDINDDKKNVVRISHYLIAKEILDQILTKGKSVKRKPSPYLCPQAKQMMGKFAVQFVKTTGEINKGSMSNMLCRTITRTFISRDNKVVGESETQASRSKKSKLSQILEDVCSHPPYTERFKILQQLNQSFPSEPQFGAHLGRLYTICRPEEEQKAEKCFKEALSMCLKDVDGLEVEDIPYTKRQDLRNIYHMYGNMFVQRTAKYTGRYLGDVPEKNADVTPFQIMALTLLKSVKSACDLFDKCRYYTPSGCEESFGYIGEIEVRLMFCDFVNSKCEEGNLHKYVENNNDEIAEFVEECYTILDELFIECFSAIEPEKMDNNVKNCTEWYAALFKDRPTHGISRLNPKDDVFSRRISIAIRKMKYSTKKSFGVLELINDTNDICFIVRGYERNFEDYEKTDGQRFSKRAIDIDYREWLYAIRHPLFQEDYEIEIVLQHVQAWHDLSSTTYSRFYLFVLKSLMGIGVVKGAGNPRLLLEAQKLKEDVLKYSKYMAKPRYPREWLGLPTSTIRRLAQGKRFFGASQSLELDLEIRTGTIRPPNDKPASGLIYLDLGPENYIPVTVFFVPARCEMKGTSYQGARVEFKIGFSMSHGYEAFDVKQLGHALCEKCGQRNEIRSCDTTVQCSSCRAEVKAK